MNEWTRSEHEHKAAALHNLGWERGAGAAIWSRAVRDELADHEAARDAWIAGATDRETWERLHATALLVVVAIDQVLSIEHRVRRLTGDDELNRARRRFDSVCRDAEQLRDLIAHFDAYAVGAGERQTGLREPRLDDQYPSPFIYWGNGGGTVLDLGGSQVNLRTAATAAVELADVVERVREQYLERAERDANVELRERFGLAPE